MTSNGLQVSGPSLFSIQFRGNPSNSAFKVAGVRDSAAIASSRLNFIVVLAKAVVKFSEVNLKSQWKQKRQKTQKRQRESTEQTEKNGKDGIRFGSLLFPFVPFHSVCSVLSLF